MAGSRFPFRDVVLVADILADGDIAVPMHLRRDLEKTDSSTLQSLVEAIASLGLNVHQYSGPAALADRAAKHSNDIVWSIYGGQASRNRMALVPAVCETFGLKFIGPDVYGRVIAQDKEVTKRLALDCSVKTPAWRIIRTSSDVRHIAGLRFPVVVKPLMEGSSIGISQRNRATSLKDAIDLAGEVLASFAQPVLVEEFVAGREVAYSRIENAGSTAWAFSEVIIEGQTDFFENRLFDANEKSVPTKGRSVRNIDDELLAVDQAALDALLNAFGTYGYCRVDGRLAGGHFYFIELTPDAWIAPRGQFARGFTEKGWSYTAVIAAILASARQCHPDR